MNCRRGLIFFVVLVLLTFLPTKVGAIALDKTVYTEGDQILTQEAGGALIFWNLNSDAANFIGSEHEAGVNINIGGIFGQGSYVIMEHQSGDNDCYWLLQTAEECRNSPEFLSEFFFTVNPISSGGGEGEENPEPAPSGGRRVNPFPPDVSPFSIKKNTLFSKDFLIDYKARLQNERGNGYEDDPNAQVNLKPVSLFYSDRLTNLYGGLISQEYKIPIAKDLPAVGQYKWSIKDLIPGALYRLIINALDSSGRLGEQVSEFFGVDFVAPTFVVTVDPPVAKQENVTITVISSESLVTAPKVAVRQRGAEAAAVEVLEKDGLYTGVYSVTDGFDGTAQVEVEGDDMAGNTGTTIVGGGTFTVGVNPPVKPVIISPAQNEKVVSERIDIHGSTRDDVSIVAMVNGVDKYQARPNKKGEFVIKGVTLNKKAPNGKNIINITSRDIFDVVSDGAVLSVFFNIAPAVDITRPKSGSILSGMTVIKADGADDNSDVLNYRYEISKEDGSSSEGNWSTLGNVPSDTFNFDTTKFEDGKYSMRVTADDGMTGTVSNSVLFTIRNESSFFIRFYDGLRTIVKEKSATVRGVAYAQKNILPSPSIKGLWYSLNDGAKWIKVLPQDGVFDSGEERFSVLIQNLEDGINHVLWRTKDSRGLFVTTEQPIIVDNIAPLPPVILYPKDGELLTKSNNESIEKGKISFTVRGSSEPESTISLKLGGKTYSSKTSFDGKFRLPNVSIPSNGEYKLEVVSTDEAQNTSPIISQSFLYDNPPDVVFINPRDGHGLNGQTMLSWLSSDTDGDPISNMVLSYRQIGKAFIDLGKNIKDNSFAWDTTNVPEGVAYEIKLDTSDGLTTTSTRVPFSIDHNPPQILSINLKTGVTKGDSLLESEGKASDSVSGVEFVEYRLSPVGASAKDISLIPWYKAVTTVIPHSKTVSFLIKDRSVLPDGTYNITVRTVDAVGNVSEEKSEVAAIDNSAPRVGSFKLYSLQGPVVATDNIFEGFVDEPISVVVSLESDTVRATILHGEVEIPLTKELATGLWHADLTFSKVGNIDLSISADDAVGNHLEAQPLVQIRMVEEPISALDKSQKTESLWAKILRMLHLK